MRATLPAVVANGAGQDDRLVPSPGRAGKIVNMRWDPAGWWSSDRGWEPLLGHDDTYEYPADYLNPTRFMAVWTRHQGAEVYYLYERGGSLAYDFGNDAGATETGQVVLATDRAIPGPADAGTQLVPFGRFALLLNGHNALIKFHGGNLVTPFGFPAAPAPPTIAPVDPNVLGVALASTGVGASTGGSAIGGLAIYGTTTFLGLIVGANAYAYKIAAVSESGSEGPMSRETVISWTNNLLVNPLAVGTYAPWMSLPEADDHIVLWRIYRTKNLGDQAGLTDRTFYFVADVPAGQGSFVDTSSDSRLIIVAPAASDSVPLPPGLRFGAAWDGRMWVGGGPHAPTRVWYSAKGLPEQFAAFNYFDLGSPTSGDITQILGHEGRLYIFRERGIDVVQVTDTLEYQVVTLDGHRGTTASNTIRSVPGFGLVFLARDGVYAAGPSGVRHISRALTPEWRRIGVGSLARATATWSDREQEYWVQYPADGAAENTRGAALHTAISTPESPAWSLRHVPPSDGTSVWRTIVTCLATDPDGWIVMGTSPINLTSGAYPGVLTLAALTVTNQLEGLGMQVWSARPAAGTRFTVSAIAEGFTTTQTDAPPIEAIWQSPWIEYDPRAVVHQVELWALNTGRPDLTVEVAVNGREDWTDVSADVEMAPRETAKTAENDHVYNPETTAAKFRYEGVWGTSRWREDRIVRVRWDVHLAGRSCASFAFRIRTRDHLGVVAYRVRANGTQIGTQSQVAGAGGA